MVAYQTTRGQELPTISNHTREDGGVTTVLSPFPVNVISISIIIIIIMVIFKCYFTGEHIALT